MANDSSAAAAGTDQADAPIGLARASASTICLAYNVRAADARSLGHRCRSFYELWRSLYEPKAEVRADRGCSARVYSRGAGEPAGNARWSDESAHRHRQLRLDGRTARRVIWRAWRRKNVACECLSRVLRYRPASRALLVGTHQLQHRRHVCESLEPRIRRVGPRASAGHVARGRPAQARGARDPSPHCHRRARSPGGRRCADRTCGHAEDALRPCCRFNHRARRRSAVNRGSDWRTRVDRACLGPNRNAPDVTRRARRNSVRGLEASGADVPTGRHRGDHAAVRRHPALHASPWSQRWAPRSAERPQ
jgi:hypothetical protein